MLTPKDATLIYETLLMSPGMNEAVKIPLSIKRKTLLMLTKLIEEGIAKENAREGVLSVMDQLITEELKSITENLLEKGGLSELNEKISSLKLQ